MKQNTTYCPYCMTPVQEGESCPVCGLTAGTYVPLPHHLPPGTMLMNRYLVGRVLGEGGFGITYIGCDIRLELRVAIKEYYPVDKVNRNAAVSSELVSYSLGPAREGFERGKKKFLKEARTMAKMDKQQVIVNVKDFFETNNTAYIVMEYIEGTNFTELVAQRGGRIPPQELLPTIEPLFKALSTLHKTGLIHRDISPENLMLENGRVRLIDFGCARETEPGNETLTITLKHGYAPIEQYQQKGQGTWTDVYALCGTIYYCLVGKKPPQALDRIGGENSLILPSKLGVAITHNQEKALMKGLNLSPRGRFQTMEELHSALYFPGDLPEPTKDDPAPIVEDMQPTDDPLVEEQEPAADDSEPVSITVSRTITHCADLRRKKLRRWMLWAGVTAAALLVTVLGGRLLFKNRDTAGDIPTSVELSVSPENTTPPENAYQLSDEEVNAETLRALMADDAVEALVLPDGVNGRISYLEDGNPLILTKPLWIAESAHLNVEAMTIEGAGRLEILGTLGLGNSNLRLKGDTLRLSFPNGIEGHCDCAGDLLWMDNWGNIPQTARSFFAENDGYLRVIPEDMASAKEITTIEDLKHLQERDMLHGVKITKDLVINEQISLDCPVYICEGVTVSSDPYSTVLNGPLINYGSFVGCIHMSSHSTILNYGSMTFQGTAGGGLWVDSGAGAFFLNYGYLHMGEMSRLWADNRLLNTPTGVVEAKNFYLLDNSVMSNFGKVMVTGGDEGFYIHGQAGLNNAASGSVTICRNGQMENYGIVENLGSFIVEAGGKMRNRSCLRNDGGTFRAMSGSDLSADCGSSNGVYYTRGGSIELQCINAPSFHQIPDWDMVDQMQSGPTAATAAELRSLLADSDVKTVAVTGALLWSGDLEITKPLYLSGSLNVQNGSAIAGGTQILVADGGKLEANGITLTDGASLGLLNGSASVAEKGWLKLESSLIWGWSGSQLTARNANVSLDQVSAIAVDDHFHGESFLNMDGSEIRVSNGSLLMPACHDYTTLANVDVTVESAILSTGGGLSWQDSQIRLLSGGFLLNRSGLMSLESCTLEIDSIAQLNSDFSDLHLQNTTLTNEGTVFIGRWDEWSFTMQDGSILNQGEFAVHCNSQFQGTAVMENRGRLICPASRSLDLSRISGNKPVRN